MNNLISVIIPVYNVENYLDECIQSVLQQTYKNLEIILVDDGSTDNSGVICDEYKDKDTRITVLHQKNGGISKARNVGIEYAHGEYIGFVDSDDFIHPQMYELLYAAIHKEQTDVAICREFAFFEKEELPTVQSYRITEETFETANRQKYCKKFLEAFTGPTTWAWNKLYKKECLEGVRFVEGKRMEDIRFSSDIVKNIEKAVWIPERLYFYRQRQGSIMNSGNTRIVLEHGEALIHSYHAIKKLGDEAFQKEYWKNIANRLAGLEADAYKHRYETERKELRMLSKQLYKEKLGNLGIKIALVRYFPHIYYLLK